MELTPYLISIIKAKAEHPVLASFRRDVSLAYSEDLDCRICFDTGSGINFITSEALNKMRGCKIKRIKYTDSVTYINNSEETFEEVLLIDFPLSPNLTLRRLPFYEIKISKKYDVLIGTDLLDYVVVHYTLNEISILSDSMDEASQILPLQEVDGKYYVDIEVNGRKNLFYLDTGNAEAITMPTEDLHYAKGEITVEENNLLVGSLSFPIVDHVENHGSVKIGTLEKHGPIVYLDYQNKKYVINPAVVLKEFSIDLLGSKLIVNEAPKTIL